ncbi:MAG: hypothetical protein Q9M36_15605 [Sulfurovum sp.]|nr:hypothetical protein [Sulfurovum sp.]
MRLILFILFLSNILSCPKEKFTYTLVASKYMNQSMIDSPLLVSIFQSTDNLQNKFVSFDIPIPSPAPEPQSDIHFKLLAQGNSLIEVTSSANLSLHTILGIRGFCKDTYGCRLRIKVPKLLSAISKAGISVPTDYSYKFFAPQRISSTHSNDERNLYIFT